MPNNFQSIDIHGNLAHRALRFSHNAMATIFEIFIIADDAKYAQEAAFEAFAELDRIEQDLSRYIDNSDVSRISGLAANQSVGISLHTFECLKKCIHLHKTTNGAFDITITPLLKLWQLQDGLLTKPSRKALKSARQRVGMHFLELDEESIRVKVRHDSVCIDFGGIGKGYAVDKMGNLLQDWGVECALIHGGRSSALALDAARGEIAWPVTVSQPNPHRQTLELLYLNRRSLGASGIEKGRHIIDPRTGQPVDTKIAAWALANNSTTADALSTAFMVMSPVEIESYCQHYSDTQAMVIVKKKGDDSQIMKFGNWGKSPLSGHYSN